MDEEWHSDKAQSGSQTYANGRYLERAHSELIGKMSARGVSNQVSRRKKQSSIQQNLSSEDVEAAAQGLVVLGSAVAAVAVAAFIGLVVLLAVALIVPASLVFWLHKNNHVDEIVADVFVGVFFAVVTYVVLNSSETIHWAYAAYFGFIFGCFGFLWTQVFDTLLPSTTTVQKIRRFIAEYGIGFFLFIGYWMIIEHVVFGG